MSDVRIVFVLSPFQNAFFVELAGAFAEALTTAGIATRVISEPSDHLVGDDDVFVLLPPHEYVALEGDGFLAPDVAARTIGLSAEQPHQSFFERNLETAGRLGAVLDFSPLTVAAYRRWGIDAVHQPFGYVPSWDRMSDRPGQADVPVLYLGNGRPRRLSVLAGAADALARHRAQLRISDSGEPNRADSPTFVTGAAKRDLLARTGVLINIHQSDERYFEWLRFADAAHCGTPVLTEVSDRTEPFRDGVHFESFEPDRLAARLDELVGSPQLDERAAAAYDELLRHPLAECVGPLVAAAERLVNTAPPPVVLPGRTRTSPIGRARQLDERQPRWRVPRRLQLRRTLAGWSGASELVAPPGTMFAGGAAPPTTAPLCSVLAHGIDADGDPTLEGLWPWEPWRLLHGQHLGRVWLADPELIAASRRWITEDWALEPANAHVTIALFAAVHGIEADHVSIPLATLAVPADPSQAMPAPIATRCEQILRETMR